MKAILFNTEMVQAILDGRKTTTRRIVKNIWGRQKLYNVVTELNGDKNIYAGFYENSDIFEHEGEKLVDAVYAKSKYNPGDVLYVRETWNRLPLIGYYFKAGIPKEQTEEESEIYSETKWKPSIHMPKEAARIFLRVKDVRVERLQDITDEGAKAEGSNVGIGFAEKMRETATDRFIKIWNSTVNKKDLDKYGWDSNPYVWVIEFERISKDEAFKKDKEV